MIIGYINKQSLRIGQNLVVTGTIDYLEAEFHFTDDWTGLQKQIRDFADRGVITPEQYEQITGEKY